MAIPKKILSRDLMGQKVLTAREIISDAAVWVPAGSEFQVQNVANSFTLRSGPCPCCGVTIRLDRVSRNQACLPGDPEAPYPDHVAFWQPRDAQNDYLWTQCSNCGFRVEAQKAVVTGRSSTDYVRPVYRHCPDCGKRMAVQNYAGDVVLK